MRIYKITPPNERFWPKVQQPLGIGECWAWLGAKTFAGYGIFMRKKGEKHAYAHRFAYEQIIGAIPEGHELDHLCRNPNCCNPYHCEPVTHWENTRRGTAPSAIASRKTHCIRGHPLSGDNLVPSRLSRGHRVCKTCVNSWDRIRYHNDPERRRQCIESSMRRQYGKLNQPRQK